MRFFRRLQRRAALAKQTSHNRCPTFYSAQCSRFIAHFWLCFGVCGTFQCSRHDKVSQVGSSCIAPISALLRDWLECPFELCRRLSTLCTFAHSPWQYYLPNHQCFGVGRVQTLDSLEVFRTIDNVLVPYLQAVCIYLSQLRLSKGGRFLVKLSPKEMTYSHISLLCPCSTAD